MRQEREARLESTLQLRHHLERGGLAVWPRQLLVNLAGEALQVDALFHPPGQPLLAVPGEQRDQPDLAKVHPDVIFEALDILWSRQRLDGDLAISGWPIGERERHDRVGLFLLLFFEEQVGVGRRDPADRGDVSSPRHVEHRAVGDDHLDVAALDDQRFSSEVVGSQEIGTERFSAEVVRLAAARPSGRVSWLRQRAADEYASDSNGGGYLQPSSHLRQGCSADRQPPRTSCPRRMLQDAVPTTPRRCCSAMVSLTPSLQVPELLVGRSVRSNVQPASLLVKG